MSWFRTSQLKLSLEIGQGHVHVAHGHRGIGVAEHFITVAKPMPARSISVP